MHHDDVELIGGPEQRALRLVAHDPGWQARASGLIEAIAAQLAGTAGPGAGWRARLAHIGSTSVPDLVAKPIVDLQLAVPDVDAESGYLTRLEPLGYRLRVRERQGRHRMLRSPERDVHLHVWDLDGEDERRQLLFRDHLRAHPEDVAAYAAVKRALLRRTWPTMQHYADAKTDIVTEILGRAEVWAARTGWDVAAAADVTLGSGQPGRRP